MTKFKIFNDSPDAIAFEANQIIFQEGDPATCMYAVVAGEVDLFVKDQLVETVPVGGIFGEMALIDPGNRSAVARARTDCRIVPINQKRFLFLVEETPNFALKVMQVLVARLRAMNELVLKREGRRPST
jgi:CRP-like cAMP-binding protein